MAGVIKDWQELAGIIGIHQGLTGASRKLQGASRDRQELVGAGRIQQGLTGASKD
jgi:hypothetical protein